MLHLYQYDSGITTFLPALPYKHTDIKIDKAIVC